MDALADQLTGCLSDKELDYSLASHFFYLQSDNTIEFISKCRVCEECEKTSELLTENLTEELKLSRLNRMGESPFVAHHQVVNNEPITATYTLDADRPLGFIVSQNGLNRKLKELISKKSLLPVALSSGKITNDLVNIKFHTFDQKLLYSHGGHLDVYTKVTK